MNSMERSAMTLVWLMLALIWGILAATEFQRYAKSKDKRPLFWALGLLVTCVLHIFCALLSADVHFGPHFWLFLTGGVLLLVGIILVQWYGRDKKWVRLGAGLLSLVAGVGVGLLGWAIWPSATGEHFIWLVSHYKFGSANNLLPESQRWQVAGDGSVTVCAEDGTSTTVSGDALPFVSASGGPPSRRSLTGGYDFKVGTLSKETCVIDCTAERGTVRCRHIERVGQLP
jgi:hypothetical protein